MSATWKDIYNQEEAEWHHFMHDSTIAIGLIGVVRYFQELVSKLSTVTEQENIQILIHKNI